MAGVNNQINKPYPADAADIQTNTFIAAADTGMADVYVVTLAPAIADYADNMMVIFTPANSNATATPTLNVNGKGAKNIVNYNGGTLLASDIFQMIPAICIYSLSNDNFQLLNPQISLDTQYLIQNNYFMSGDAIAGTPNAYVLTLPVDLIGGYQPNQLFVAHPESDNTGAATLAINGSPAKDIVKQNQAALVAGDILNDVNIVVVYNAGLDNFQLINPQTALTGQSAPSASAYAGGVTSLIGMTFTKVLFDTELWDTGGYFGSSRFTPLVAGYYQINSCVAIIANDPAVNYLACIYLNGANYKSGASIQSATTSGTNFTVNAEVPFNGSSDYFEIWGFNGGASNQDTVAVQAFTWVDVQWVRPL